MKITSKLIILKRFSKGSSTAHVEDEFACSADFIITIPDIFNKFKPKK